jgi:polyisoprenoid-binding protein YceI
MRTPTLALFLAALWAIPCVAGPIEGGGQRVFRLDDAAGSVTVDVEATGLLKGFAEREHELVLTRYEGEIVVVPGDPSSSRVEIRARSGDVEFEHCSKKPRRRDRVQRAMEEKVLEVERFPDIAFRSTGLRDLDCSGDTYTAVLLGELHLHGRERVVEVPVKVELSGGKIRARGTLAFEHTQYDMQCVRAAGGLVKVQDRLDLAFDLVGREEVRSASLLSLCPAD